MPATQETHVGGLRSEAGPRQKHETLPQKLLKQKRTVGVWLKC
jgi:hypothetical protein